MYSNYNSSVVVAYKCGFIYSAHYGNIEVIRVKVDGHAYAIQVKSFHSAKIMITKHNKKLATNNAK